MLRLVSKPEEYFTRIKSGSYPCFRKLNDLKATIDWGLIYKQERRSF